MPGGRSGLLTACSVASSPLFPALSVAEAFTREPSFTLSAGSVILPVSESGKITSGLVKRSNGSDGIQPSLASLIIVTVCGLPSSSM